MQLPVSLKTAFLAAGAAVILTAVTLLMQGAACVLAG
ncbi:hypothetical protein GPROT1_01214 [Gammaproteobacteria bacterium]|nr:hypothetical protein GPROT1_01214 [Gammaproteobacteria bacterium]